MGIARGSTGADGVKDGDNAMTVGQGTAEEKVGRITKTLTAYLVAGSAFSPTWRAWFERFVENDPRNRDLFERYVDQQDLGLPDDFNTEDHLLFRRRAFKQGVIWPQLTECFLAYEAKEGDAIPL